MPRAGDNARSMRFRSRQSFVHAVVPVWLVTAVWDFVCATALSVFAYGSTAAALWRSVAATLLGPSAAAGGASAVAVGIALHLAVALTWASLFVAAARTRPALREAMRTPGGALAVAAVYGPVIWLVMSLVVIPLATGRPPRFGVRGWIQVGAHIPFVALPLVFTARRVLVDAERTHDPAGAAQPS